MTYGKEDLKNLNRFDSTLSLCMRAKRLTYGFDTVKAAAGRGEVFLLLTAADLSPKTIKEVRFLAGRLSIPCYSLPQTLEEMPQLIGRKTGVIGVTDQGFAAKLTLAHNETEDTIL
jgi:ribosomal protein L7Ae-like RNA K-turn-binding protein